MERVDKAAARFEEGFACSQAVLFAFAQDFGLSDELALRVAGAFGGGIARTGGTCGAASGALMAIGLKYAMVDATGSAAKEECHALGRVFLDSFCTEHGSTQCRDLIGIDISTSAGLQEARVRGVFRTICPAVVRSAVRLAEELIED